MTTAEYKGEITGVEVFKRPHVIQEEGKMFIMYIPYVCGAKF